MTSQDTTRSKRRTAEHDPYIGRVQHAVTQLSHAGRPITALQVAGDRWERAVVGVADVAVSVPLLKRACSAIRLGVLELEGDMVLDQPEHLRHLDCARQDLVRDLRQTIMADCGHPHAEETQAGQDLARGRRAGLYMPEPSRQVPIPKLQYRDPALDPSILARLLASRSTQEHIADKPRALTIPPVVVRALAGSLNQLFSAYLEPRWSNLVVAYRPGISRLQILSSWANAVATTGCSYAVSTDLRGFYDSVLIRDALQLLDRETGYSADPLLARMVAYALGGDLSQPLPQGNPLSGLLANLYAAHRLDPALQRIGPALRYSDDILLLVRDPIQATRAMAEIQAAATAAGLTLHPAKTMLIDLQRGEQRRLDQPDAMPERACYLGAEMVLQDGMLQFSLSNFAIRRLVEGLRQTLHLTKPSSQTTIAWSVEQLVRLRLQALGWLRQHAAVTWSPEQEQAVDWILRYCGLTDQGFGSWLRQQARRSQVSPHELQRRVEQRIKHVGGYRVDGAAQAWAQAGAETVQCRDVSQRLVGRHSPLGTSVAAIRVKEQAHFRKALGAPVRLALGWLEQEGATTMGLPRWSGRLGRVEALDPTSLMLSAETVTTTGPTTKSEEAETSAIALGVEMDIETEGETEGETDDKADDQANDRFVAALTGELEREGTEGQAADKVDDKADAQAYDPKVKKCVIAALALTTAGAKAEPKESAKAVVQAIDHNSAHALAGTQMPFSSGRVDPESQRQVSVSKRVGHSCPPANRDDARRFKTAGRGRSEPTGCYEVEGAYKGVVNETASPHQRALGIIPDTNAPLAAPEMANRPNTHIPDDNYSFNASPVPKDTIYHPKTSNLPRTSPISPTPKGTHTPSDPPFTSIPTIPRSTAPALTDEAPGTCSTPHPLPLRTNRSPRTAPGFITGSTSPVSLQEFGRERPYPARSTDPADAVMSSCNLLVPPVLSPFNPQPHQPRWYSRRPRGSVPRGAVVPVRRSGRRGWPPGRYTRLQPGGESAGSPPCPDRAIAVGRSTIAGFCAFRGAAQGGIPAGIARADRWTRWGHGTTQTALQPLGCRDAPLDQAGSPGSQHPGHADRPTRGRDRHPAADGPSCGRLGRERIGPGVARTHRGGRAGAVVGRGSPSGCRAVAGHPGSGQASGCLPVTDLPVRGCGSRSQGAARACRGDRIARGAEPGAADQRVGCDGVPLALWRCGHRADPSRQDACDRQDCRPVQARGRGCGEQCAALVHPGGDRSAGRTSAASGIPVRAG